MLKPCLTIVAFWSLKALLFLTPFGRPLLSPNLMTSSLPSKNLGHLIIAIQAGTTIGASNRSLILQHYLSLGTATWVSLDVECSFPSICCGVSQVPVQASAIDAYLAELHGLLTLTHAVTFICKQHNITTSYVTIACDNHGAICQMNNNYIREQRNASLNRF